MKTKKTKLIKTSPCILYFLLAEVINEQKNKLKFTNQEEKK